MVIYMYVVAVKYGMQQNKRCRKSNSQPVTDSSLILWCTSSLQDFTLPLQIKTRKCSLKCTEMGSADVFSCYRHLVFQRHSICIYHHKGCIFTRQVQESYSRVVSLSAEQIRCTQEQQIKESLGNFLNGFDHVIHLTMLLSLNVFSK